MPETPTSPPPPPWSGQQPPAQAQPSPGPGSQAAPPTPQIALPPGVSVAPEGDAQQKDMPLYTQRACHRSWLMATRIVAQHRMHGGELVQVPGTQAPVPHPSPYGCLGPQCWLWSDPHQKCKDIVVRDLQIAKLERDLDLSTGGITAGGEAGALETPETPEAPESPAAPEPAGVAASDG